MINKQLIRTDKNGTKYFHVACTCGKCGGSGYIGYYHFNQGGVCFDCGGSGVVEYMEKEMTPEYEAKLEARRKKRQEKKDAEMIAKSDELNQEFLEKNGFSPDGKTFVVLGNTYPIKDELKEAGAKWSNLIGWHFAIDHSEYPTVEILADDIYNKDYRHLYIWNLWKRNDEETYSAKIQKANDELKGDVPASEYVGEIGDKVSVKVKYVHTSSWENNFGYGYWQQSVTNLHKFVDEDGNVFTWKTSTYIECDEGTDVILSGRIKDHNEYKNEKQTVMTRCSVKGVA